MSTSEKLDSDYRSFIKKAEQTAAADLEKIRSELDELRRQAAVYSGDA